MARVLESRELIQKPVESLNVVHMISSCVAGESKNLEMIFAGKAQLLHPERPPLEDRLSLDGEGSEQIVGRFRCARVRSGKDFRMRNQKTFV